MERIKDTIANVMQELQAQKPGTLKDDPERLLKKVLKKRELSHIKFHYFRKGVLGVYVDSSAWLYNFNLKKEDILRQLNRRLETIKGIRFRIGDIK
jgi:hypothetical protein